MAARKHKIVNGAIYYYCHTHPNGGKWLPENEFPLDTHSKTLRRSNCKACFYRTLHNFKKNHRNRYLYIKRENMRRARGFYFRHPELNPRMEKVLNEQFI